MSTSAPSPNATSPTSLGSVVVVETVTEGTDDASGFHYESDDSLDESKGESLATSATGGTGEDKDAMECGKISLEQKTECMVIKSNGNTCGAKVGDCTKKNHQQLQKAIPSRRGRDGVYDGIFRGKNAKHPDGIASTWMSFKAFDLSRATQRSEMEAVGLSSQRQAAERLASPRGDSMVTFNDTLLATPVTSPRKQAPTSMPSLIPAGESEGLSAKTIDGPATTVDLTQEPTRQRPSQVTDQQPYLAARGPDAVTAQSDQISKLMEAVTMMAMSQTAMTQSQNTATAKMEHLTTTFNNAFEALREKQPHQDPSPPPTIIKWYAVARGRVPGVYATEMELEQQVHGFPDSYYKIFLIKQDAQDWLRLELASYGLNTPEVTDNVRAGKDHNRGTTEPTRGNEGHNIMDQKRYQESITGPARIHGEDSSKGEAEKIYGASIYTGEAVKLLSPPNSSTETMEDLMEAVPDVTSPGKLVDSASEATDQMANSLQALAEQNAQRTNVMMKDTQWKNKARSALSKVKSMETLIELYEEVDEQQLKVGESAKHAVAEILRRACWPETLIEQYLETGGIVRLIERSQFLWMQLLLHFQKLQKGSDQWESTAQLHVEYFTKKLLLIRKYAPTRSVMVQEVYCFLRDEAVKRFMSLSLLSRVTEYVQTRLILEANKLTDGNPGDTSTKTKSQRCSHCHSSSIHEGGTYNCVLKTWKSKIARTLATEIARQAITGDELLNVVLKEVLEREINNKG